MQYTLYSKVVNSSVATFNQIFGYGGSDSRFISVGQPAIMGKRIQPLIAAVVTETNKILHDLVGLIIGIEAYKNLVVVHFKNRLKNILFNLGGVTAGYLQWIDEFAIRKWEHSHFLIAR